MAKSGRGGSAIHTLTAAAAVVSLSGGIATAQDHEQLIEALRIVDTVTIMRLEGLDYADELGQEMLPNGSGEGWTDAVSRIYDTEKMSTVIADGLSEALSGQDMTEATAFFTSDLGREIVKLELSAREAMLDEDTELAARESFEAASDDQTWQYTEVIGLIDDSDLVDFNVMGALNSNYAFYRGLADGNALEMSEEDMLAEVWAQENELRSESESWLGAYLLLAYQSLSQEELEAYASLYRSDEGQSLNAAIFAAYDQMYEEMSYLLGRAVAVHMQGQEL